MKKEINSKSHNKSKVNALNKSRESNTKIKITPENLDAFFDKQIFKVLWIPLILTVLCGILLFDVRINLSGDDLGYIERAYNFIKEGKFPGFQGPLYPIILSLPIAFFGINQLILRSLSLVFITGAVFLTYKAFVYRIPSYILFVTLILISVNSYLLYYSSQTYSEAFFMLIQALFIYTFFRFNIDREKETNPFKLFTGHLIVGTSAVLLCLTRNAAYAVIIALFVYFVIRKDWKNLALSIGSFIIIYSLFQLTKFLIWHDVSLQFSSQFNSLLVKDYYKPNLGHENFIGFLKRFIDNSNLYISKHFFIILGLRPDNSDSGIIPVLTILTYILFITGILFSLKKNKYILFTGIYTGIICLSSFLILQTIWDQNRIIIPYVPFLILFLLISILYLIKFFKIKKLYIILIIVPLIILSSTTARTYRQVREVKKTIGIYDGLTPDWINYIKLSKWIAKSLPPSNNIICRKPTISFIYGNCRKFSCIYKLPSCEKPLIISDWKSNKDKYFLITLNSISKKNFSDHFYYSISNQLDFLIQLDTSIYFVFETPKQNKEYIFKTLDSLKISNYNNNEYWIKLIQNNTINCMIYSPDSVLNYLRRINADYLIDSKIRKYSDRNTNQTIDANAFYMFLVKCKFPNAFTKVIQMGGNNNEPSSLYRINYK